MSELHQSLQLSPAQIKLAEAIAEDLKRSAMAALIAAKDMPEVARAQGAISNADNMLARLKR